MQLSVFQERALTLAVMSGELMPGQPAPLLKRRRELSGEEGIRLWRQMLRQGWQVCPPQWVPQASLYPR